MDEEQGCGRKQSQPANFGARGQVVPRHTGATAQAAGFDVSITIAACRMSSGLGGAAVRASNVKTVPNRQRGLAFFQVDPENAVPYGAGLCAG